MQYLQAMDIQAWSLRELVFSGAGSAESPAAPVQELHAAAGPAGLSCLDGPALAARIAACKDCPELGRPVSVSPVGKPGGWLVVIAAPAAAPGDGFFSGEMARLFAAMLQANALTAVDIHLASVLKCPLPEQAGIKPDWLENCLPYLQREIELLQPRVILALGALASRALLQSSGPLDDLRGKVHDHAGFPLIASYHPADLLASPADKRKAWMDWCLARKTVQERAGG